VDKIQRLRRKKFRAANEVDSGVMTTMSEDSNAFYSNKSLESWFEIDDNREMGQALPPSPLYFSARFSITRARDHLPVVVGQSAISPDLRLNIGSPSGWIHRIIWSVHFIYNSLASSKTNESDKRF
jgi:hypothetical protein